jgi:hypothetical protein
VVAVVVVVAGFVVVVAGEVVVLVEQPATINEVIITKAINNKIIFDENHCVRKLTLLFLL